MKNPFQKEYLFPIALTTGVLGFILRLWLYLTGFDNRGLLMREHPAYWVAFVLIAVALLMLFLCLKDTDIKSLPFRASPVALAGCLAAAAGIVAADLFELSRQPDRVTVISCLLGIVAAICLVVAGLQQQKGKKSSYYLHGILTIYLMVHLISQYRVWNAEPQLQEYFFQLMASIFLMFTAYQRTLLDSGNGNPKNFLLCNYAAAFLCCFAVVGENRLFYIAMALWTIGNGICADLNPMELPENVLYCLNALKEKGYQAFVVGGCVRDHLLGLEPQDHDICTDATPEQIANVFSHCELVRNGEKHGTIGVVLDHELYEITTFRTEGSYSDSRHPDWVEFVTDIKEDLARRDFTVNAMAYAPETGIIDPWGGREDLADSILRTVGDAHARFTEDALRILRGVRFAVRFRLTPEENTLAAMNELAPLMDNLARERLFLELCKLIVHVTWEDLMLYTPVITRVIPELAEGVGFDQHSPHHAYDVYTHTAKVTCAVPNELPLRLAALLHDVGKPAVFTTDEDGRGHFYGHAQIGANKADEILQRLKAPTALREQVVLLIKNHMTAFEPDKKQLRRALSKYGTETMQQLLTLQKADYAGKGVDEGEDDIFNQVEALLAEIAEEDACLRIQDLAIDGNDLMELGFTPGPAMGQVLQSLLEMVQDEVLANDADALRSAAENMKE